MHRLRLSVTFVNWVLQLLNATWLIFLTAYFNSTHLPHPRRASPQLTFLTPIVLQLNSPSPAACFNSTPVNSTDLPLPLPASLLFSASRKRCLLCLLSCLHRRYSVHLLTGVCFTFFAAYIAVIHSLSEAVSDLPSPLPTSPLFSPSLKRCLLYLLRCLHRRYSVPL